MEFNEFLKNVAAIPTRKKLAPYKKINGCTKQFECQQVFWSLCIMAMVVLYSVFASPVFFQWPSPALIVFMFVAYIAVVIMVYDYLYLTIVDPVDPRIRGQSIGADAQTKFCSLCEKHVALKTFHCMKCLRCTYHLDHHSQILNNCVSAKNIVNYIRMSICLTLSLGIISIETIIIFALSFSNSQLNELLINKWIVVAIGFFAGISVITSGYNLIFCLYINVYEKIERIQYLYRERQSNNSEIESTYKASTTHPSQRQMQDNQNNNK